MGLDFAIGKSKHDLSFDEFAGCLDDEVHAELFADPVVTKKLCPQLLKIQTYYCDAHYRGIELKAMWTGLDKALLRFADRPEILKPLRRLRDACILADKEGLSLFFFGD